MIWGYWQILVLLAHIPLAVLPYNYTYIMPDDVVNPIENVEKIPILPYFTTHNELISKMHTACDTFLN
jgi:hypothetical protein